MVARASIAMSSSSASSRSRAVSHAATSARAARAPRRPLGGQEWPDAPIRDIAMSDARASPPASPKSQSGLRHVIDRGKRWPGAYLTAGPGHLQTVHGPATASGRHASIGLGAPGTDGPPAHSRDREAVVAPRVPYVRSPWPKSAEDTCHPTTVRQDTLSARSAGDSRSCSRPNTAARRVEWRRDSPRARAQRRGDSRPE